MIKKLNLDNKKEMKIPEAYKKIAVGIEKQFLNIMLEKMKETARPEKESAAEKYYSSLLTNEHSEILAKKNDGLGIGKLILKQILPHSFKANQQKDLRKPYSKGLKL